MFTTAEGSDAHSASIAFYSQSGWRRAVAEARNNQGLITSDLGEEQSSGKRYQDDRRSRRRRHPAMSVAVHMLDLGRIGLNGGATGEGQVKAICQMCVEAQDSQANQRSLPRSKGPFSPGELAKPWHGTAPPPYWFRCRPTAKGYRGSGCPLRRQKHPALGVQLVAFHGPVGPHSHF